MQVTAPLELANRIGLIGFGCHQENLQALQCEQWGVNSSDPRLPDARSRVVKSTSLGRVIIDERKPAVEIIATCKGLVRRVKDFTDRLTPNNVIWIDGEAQAFAQDTAFLADL